MKHIIRMLSKDDIAVPLIALVFSIGVLTVAVTAPLNDAVIRADPGWSVLYDAERRGRCQMRCINMTLQCRHNAPGTCPRDFDNCIAGCNEHTITKGQP